MTLGLLTIVWSAAQPFLFCFASGEQRDELVEQALSHRALTRQELPLRHWNERRLFVHQPAQFACAANVRFPPIPTQLY